MNTCVTDHSYLHNTPVYLLAMMKLILIIMLLMAVLHVYSTTNTHVHFPYPLGVTIDLHAM